MHFSHNAQCQAKKLRANKTTMVSKNCCGWQENNGDKKPNHISI